MTDRVQHLLGGANQASSRIIEIGPSHAPIASKAAGWRSFVVDHTDQAGLRGKYRGLPVDLDAIEPVDCVWADGPLDGAVPRHLHGSFDLLIASHVIEHLPDPVGFLAAADRLLAPDGVVALAIPDRRFCFDYFRPATTTGQVLEAYFGQRTRHPARALWDHATMAVNLDGVGAWGQHPVATAAFLSDAFTRDAARLRFTEPGEAAPYEDCHAWAFTPAGFSLLMLELVQLAMTEWGIQSLVGPAGCEFIVRLRRGQVPIANARSFQTRRLELLGQQLSEVAEQIAYAEAGGLIGPRQPVASAGRADLQARIAEHEERLTAIEERFHRLRRASAPVLRILRAMGLYPTA